MPPRRNAASAELEEDSVSIRPGVGMLGAFRRMNYKPWYAMAEFVDNSIQSFLTNRKVIEAEEGKNAKLTIEIEIDNSDGGRIMIRDDAAGIGKRDYVRAFETANAPQDKEGLSEYGIGLKSAACWFANNWIVRTKALGEDVERTIAFDVDKIVRTGTERLKPKVRKVTPKAHYTEIVMTNLNRPMQGRTVGKILEHLSSMYRVLLRDEKIELRFNGKPVSYETPEILVAPPWNDKRGKPIKWYTEFNFNLGDGAKAHGFAAIRAVMSSTQAGFSLFRRRRLIAGSGDETYRPHEISGAPGSFPYKRIFGEIHITGIDVTHTKDGFEWGDKEEILIRKLKEKLSEKNLPLLRQAVELRSEQDDAGYERIAKNTLKLIDSKTTKRASAVLQRNVETMNTRELPLSAEPAKKVLGSKVLDIRFDDVDWKINLEITRDGPVYDWIWVDAPSDQPPRGEPRPVNIRLSLAHPFAERYAASSAALEAITNVGIALALAEVLARQQGAKQVGKVRYIVNDLLRDALTKG